MAIEAAKPASRSDIVGAMRQAAVAGLLAFGLFLPLIGFNTVQNIRNELVLETRWLLLATFVGIIAGGRFFHALLLAPWLARRAVRQPGQRLPVSRRAQIARWIVPFTLGFAMAYPPLAFSLAGFQGAVKWIDNFGVQILIYVMLGWGLNIVVGLAGLLDLGYVAFYAVGAYSYALLAKTFGLSFWILLPLAGCLAAFWGILLGFPVLRLRGDYLAIVTLAFGEIIRLVLINWVPVTNGYAGISGIPRPTFFGIPFNATEEGFAARFGLEFSPIYRTIFLYYVILALALITAAITTRLRQLPIGRAWEALREDEIACRSLGINTTNTKLTAFAIGAMFAGFAGSFFAARQGFISPESFTFMESAVIVAMVVLGGMGSLMGVAIAAVIMIGGTEIMRELDFLKTCSERLRSDTIPHAVVRLRHGADRRSGNHAGWLPRASPRRSSTSARRWPAHWFGRAEDDDYSIPQRGRRSAANDDDRRESPDSPACGSPQHALWWPYRHQRSFVHCATSRHHRPDRAQRRRQDNRVQLHHRLLQANRGTYRAAIRQRERVGRARRLDRLRQAQHARGGGVLFLLERLPDYLVTQKARVTRTFQNIRLFQGMTVLENLLVAQHNPLMQASGYGVLGAFRLPVLHARRADGNRSGPLLARQDRSDRTRR